jgi:outer membrane cobalamin receptor
MPGNFVKRCLFQIGLPLMLATAHGIALAGEPVQTLDTVTVTDERFPVKEKASHRFVTVVTAEELKQSGADNLVDAIKRKGGLGYKAFGPLGISHGGMSSKLTIRGIEDGELVLINGVPVQGATGHTYDLDAIPIDQVERVEILKGAASTLYGADAMTGVINIITTSILRPTSGLLKSSGPTPWCTWEPMPPTNGFRANRLGSAPAIRPRS